MVAVPAATPVIIPVEAPIVAIAVLLLLHVPPPAAVNGLVAPTHTPVAPLIVDPAITLIVLVAMQLPIE